MDFMCKDSQVAMERYKQTVLDLLNGKNGTEMEDETVQHSIKKLMYTLAQQQEIKFLKLSKQEK
jgi:hypothetical protein